MKLRIAIVFVFSCLTGVAQVGIGTINPQGALDVTSTNMGLVIPRVANFEVVTDGAGNPPVNGTMVYDIARDKNCYKISDKWICTGFDESGSLTTEESIPTNTTNCTYVKASNTEDQDFMGVSMVISDDGNYMAVGATREDSDATGVGGDESSNASGNSGAVYLYVRSGGVWSQQAYIKASNTNFSDNFGISVSLSSDGSRLAVGATGEDSNATGIGGDQSNNTSSDSGAVYIFTRTGSTWSQEAYIKASNNDSYDNFGDAVSLSDDGSRLAVGAQHEDSNATGVGGDQSNNSAFRSGATYVFSRSGTTWTQEAYIKASNTDANDYFGEAVDIDQDGDTIAVGTYREASNASGIDGDQTDNSAYSTGAVYVFTRTGTTWSQQAYIKSSASDAGDSLGISLALSSSGDDLIAGAMGEGGYDSGLGGDQNSNGVSNSGAAFLFTRSGSSWSQTQYIKACNVGANDGFGYSVDLNNTATILAGTARSEQSNATGINGDMYNNSLTNAGAAYIFDN